MKLTPHFDSTEFACKDAARTPVPTSHLDELRRVCETFLEPMRAKFGVCRVHSGFRTPEHNKAVGGARSSFHVYIWRKPHEGVAVDVSFERGTPADWRRKARRLRRSKRGGRGGLGYYVVGGFVHIDSRDYAANWDGP